MSRVLLRLFAATLTIALSLVAAEYATRFVFRNSRSSGNARDFVAGRAGPTIVNNRLGYREREIPAKGQRYRVAVVGDSFTWGQGIEVAERFSNLLEASVGPRIEVLNFGRPGNNMPEHLDVLQDALGVSPDFILLQLYINDFETRQMVRPEPYPLLPGSWHRSLEKSSLLYDLMNRQWADVQPKLGIVDDYQGYMARNLRDPNGPNSQMAFGQLRQFIERAHQAGVACGVVLFPAPDAMGPHGSHYPFGYLHEGVTATCAAERIPCLDLLPVFSTIENPRTMWVSPFDAHPNAMANQRAAQEMLRQFAPLWHGRSGD